MRVISGNLRGKKLIYPDNEMTRPLRDMVKESIFNLIEHSKKINFKLNNSKILDLFSGSGSFGIECISREAGMVTFVENNKDTLKVLEKNLLGISQTDKFELIKKDCFKYLKEEKLKFYNLIFMDPPFKEIKINQLITDIKNKKILSSDGIIIVHRHKKDNVKLSESINILDERIYGISKITIGN